MYERVRLKKFYPKEDLDYYLNPKNNEVFEWGESPTEKELNVFFDLNPPEGTSIFEVFPHCKPCIKYPIIEDNLYLYKLSESKEFKGLFYSLDYFNLLYEKLKFCLDNINGDPEIILENLKSINLTKQKLFFILYSLHFIIAGLNGSVTADRMWPEGITTLKNEKLGKIDLGLIDLYQGMEKELEIETENTDIPNSIIRSKINLKFKNQFFEKFSIKQIALIKHYEEVLISRNNASQIAANYGFYSINSGEKLYQEFCFYHSNNPNNRTSVPKSIIKQKNKIDLFNSIIEHLSDKAKERVIKDISEIQVNKNKDQK